MRPSEGIRAKRLALAVFFSSAAAATPALADEVTEFAQKAWEHLREFRPTHLLAISFFLLVVAVFGKFRQASGFFVLISFFGSALALAAFFVFWLTGDLMRRNPQHAMDMASAKEAEPDLKAAPPRVAVAAGGSCKRDRDCANGTVCAHVGPAHQCFAPCGPHDSCAPGYTCVPEGKQRVCVR